jgi:hypothetical protein
MSGYIAGITKQRKQKSIKAVKDGIRSLVLFVKKFSPYSPRFAQLFDRRAHVGIIPLMAIRLNSEVAITIVKQRFHRCEAVVKR